MVTWRTLINHLKWQRKRSRAHCLLFRGSYLWFMLHYVPCPDVWNSYISHWYPLVRLDSVRLFSAGYGLNSIFLVAVKHDIAPDVWLIFPSCPLSAHLGASTFFIKSFIGCALLVAHFTSFFGPRKINRSSTNHIKNSQFALRGTSCSGPNEARSLGLHWVFFLQKLQERTEALWAKGKQVGSPDIMMT